VFNEQLMSDDVTPNIDAKQLFSAAWYIRNRAKMVCFIRLASEQKNHQNEGVDSFFDRPGASFAGFFSR
jgi:hypothetical protein